MKIINLHNIHDYACQLMAKHNLHYPWVFKLDRAKRRAGRCTHYKKVISLSYHHVILNNDEEITDTILHEIAHALAGPGVHHGPKWKAIARQIGARPERCYDADKVTMPKGKYEATCPTCKKTFHKHRRPKAGRIRYCAKCGSDKGRLTFSIASCLVF